MSIADFKPAATQIRQAAESFVSGSGDAWSSTADCRLCQHQEMYWCADGSKRPSYDVARMRVVRHVLDSHTDRVLQAVAP